MKYRVTWFDRSGAAEGKTREFESPPFSIQLSPTGILVTGAAGQMVLGVKAGYMEVERINES